MILLSLGKHEATGGAPRAAFHRLKRKSSGGGLFPEKKRRGPTNLGIARIWRVHASTKERHRASDAIDRR